MEEWQEELIREAGQYAERDIERARQNLTQRIAKIQKALELKVKIIASLREEPESIFGETDVYVRTGNHQLVHDVVKTLGVKLERSAEADGFNFKGSHDGILINVYGMSEVPHCKIVPKKEKQEVTIYEIVCNEKETEESE